MLIRLLFFLQAHTSSVSHLDWSKDGENLQSTSTDYELLFCKRKLCFDPAYKYTIVVKENTCYPSACVFLFKGTPYKVSRSQHQRVYAIPNGTHTIAF